MKLPRMSKHLSTIGQEGQQTTSNNKAFNLTTNGSNVTDIWQSAGRQHESQAAVSTQTRENKYLIDTNLDERPLSVAQIQQIYEIYDDSVATKKQDPKQSRNEAPEITERQSVTLKQQNYESYDDSVAAKRLKTPSSFKQTRRIDAEKNIILNTPKNLESRSKTKSKINTRKINKNSEQDSKFSSFWDSFFRF